MSNGYHTSAAPEVPHGCIESSHLRSLANALDRLGGWHELMGGAMPGKPCLRRVGHEADKIVAVVTTGEITIRLVLERGEWAQEGAYK